MLWLRRRIAVPAIVVALAVASDAPGVARIRSARSGCPSRMAANHPAARPGGRAVLVPAGARSVWICRYRGPGDPSPLYFKSLAGAKLVSDPAGVSWLAEQFDELSRVVPPSELGPYVGPPSCPERDDGYFTARFVYPSGPKDVLVSGSDSCMTVTNGSRNSYVTFSPNGYSLLAAIDELTGCRASEVGPCDSDRLPAGLTPWVRLSLAVSRHDVSYGGRPVLLRIRMQTGISPMTVGVGLILSGWPDPGVIGSPLAFGGERVSGAGRILGHFASSGIGFAGPVCLRGTYTNGQGGADLLLPAKTVTTLSYELRLAVPPWPGLDPTVGVFAYEPAVGQGSRTYTIGLKRLRVVGRTAVKIKLSIASGALRRTGPTSAVVRQRRRVVIAGSTNPSAANALVTLRAQPYAPLGKRARSLAIGGTRTLPDGSFQLAWHPPRAGTYMVTATLADPRPGALPASTCDLTLTAS
jgi:hypothetical protein